MSGRVVEARTETRRIEIPVMPECMGVIAELVGDEEAGLDDWARTLEGLPVLAARLVALANSPWSSPRTEVVTIAMACRRLGLNVVKTVSIAISISNRYRAGLCPAFDRIRFWTESIFVAELGRRLALAAGRDGGGAGLTYSAGLFHNLGLLWLASSLPSETDRAIVDHASSSGNGSLSSHLRRHCGLGYCEAGRVLGEDWGLPAPIVEAMAGHRDPVLGAGPVVETIHLATGLAGDFLRGREPLGDPRVPSGIVDGLAEVHERASALVESMGV